ncbi:cell division protein SepF [Bacillus coahuilensis m2-6]|uniref:cell division protein SepF n=1 Tax=Bacillus coahuilensis TaxID=408580 RepID=UPI0001850E74|nr:cell division protein SepF [Bacillus coahuilensis]KUP08587.1 cell division protein SepF [Bacillus coahuilensis m2-6]
MGIGTSFKKLFFYEDEDEYDYVEEKSQSFEEEQPMLRSKQKQKQNVVSLQSVQKQSKMMIVEPRMYSEAQEIADHLKGKRSVLVNLQRVSHDQAKRIIDFLSGTVYALGGDIQKVGVDIFLCTPDTVEVQGAISALEEIEDSHNSRW